MQVKSDIIWIISVFLWVRRVRGGLELHKADRSVLSHELMVAPHGICPVSFGLLLANWMGAVLRRPRLRDWVITRSVVGYGAGDGR